MLYKRDQNAIETINFTQTSELRESTNAMLPWIITQDFGGDFAFQILATEKCAEWLHERLNTLEYLQGAHRRGGSSTSEAKQIASRENGKKSVQIKGVPDDMAYAECVSD